MILGIAPNDKLHKCRDDGGQGCNQHGDSVQEPLCQSQNQLQGSVQDHG